MIVNLFSSFDPTTSIGTLNWNSIFIFLLVLPPIYWLKPSKLSILNKNLNSNFLKETDIIIETNKIKRIFISSLFYFIIFNNFLGLFPYIFTATSHITVTLTLSIIIWSALIIYGWVITRKKIFAHLVPIRTPKVLIPFMVLIERIRNLIRPLTLAIRLSANIIAGHLLLTLLGNKLASLRMITLILPTEIALIALEIAVSIIQAYVFSILVTLYVREVREDH